MALCATYYAYCSSGVRTGCLGEAAVMTNLPYGNAAAELHAHWVIDRPHPRDRPATAPIRSIPFFFFGRFEKGEGKKKKREQLYSYQVKSEVI